MSHLDSQRWFLGLGSRDNPSARLFCFPYAGGSATIYRDWSELLPREIEVCPVQLPGRPGRMEEPALDDLGEVTDAVIEAMDPFTDLPYALYGHSMGSLLAYELARRQWREARPGPVHLFIGARRAPHLISRAPAIHEEPAERVRSFLKTLRVVPDEVLDHDELMELLLPTLRADLKLDVTYAYEPGSAVACPIDAFGGIEDHYVLKGELAAWSMHTGSAFSLQMIPGDHFFLDDPRKRLPLIDTIRRELAAFL